MTELRVFRRSDTAPARTGRHDEAGVAQTVLR